MELNVQQATNYMIEKLESLLELLESENTRARKKHKKLASTKEVTNEIRDNVKELRGTLKEFRDVNNGNDKQPDFSKAIENLEQFERDVRENVEKSVKERNQISIENCSRLNDAMENWKICFKTFSQEGASGAASRTKQLTMVQDQDKISTPSNDARQTQPNDTKTQPNDLYTQPNKKTGTGDLRLQTNDQQTPANNPWTEPKNVQAQPDILQKGSIEFRNTRQEAINKIKIEENRPIEKMKELLNPQEEQMMAAVSEATQVPEEVVDTEEPEGARCEEEIHPVPADRKKLPDSKNVIDETPSNSGAKKKSDTRLAAPDSEAALTTESRERTKTTPITDAEEVKAFKTFLGHSTKTPKKSASKTSHSAAENTGMELRERNKMTLKILPTSTEFLDFEIDSKDLIEPGSKWTVEMFIKIVDKLQISYNRKVSDKELTEQVKDLSEKIKDLSEKIKANYKEKAIAWTDLTEADMSKDVTKSSFKVVIEELQYKDHIEAKMCKFIEAFFDPLMEAHDLKRNTEEHIKSYAKEHDELSKKLPDNKLDYTVYCRSTNGETFVPIGCIEAKGSKTLVPSSIVQCMLQLLSLRTKTKNAIFNILTDGIHFVFLSLNQENVFQLETSSTKGEVVKFQKYDIKTGNNLKKVVARVSEILQEAKSQVPK